MLIEGRVVARTNRAILLDCDEEATTGHWVPLSVIEDSEDLKACDFTIQELEIKDWFCVKEGLG